MSINPIARRIGKLEDDEDTGDVWSMAFGEQRCLTDDEIYDALELREELGRWPAHMQNDRSVSIWASTEIRCRARMCVDQDHHYIGSDGERYPKQWGRGNTGLCPQCRQIPGADAIIDGFRRAQDARLADE